MNTYTNTRPQSSSTYTIPQSSPTHTSHSLNHTTINSNYITKDSYTNKNQIKKLLILPALTIKNISYFNTKMAIYLKHNAIVNITDININDDYHYNTNSYKNSYATDPLTHKLNRIKHKVDLLHKSNIHECITRTQYNNIMENSILTNDNILNAFIQRKAVYNISAYIDDLLLLHKQEHVNNLNKIKHEINATPNTINNTEPNPTNNTESNTTNNTNITPTNNININILPILFKNYLKHISTNTNINKNSINTIYNNINTNNTNINNYYNTALRFIKWQPCFLNEPNNFSSVNNINNINVNNINNTVALKFLQYNYSVFLENNLSLFDNLTNNNTDTNNNINTNNNNINESDIYINKLSLYIISSYKSCFIYKDLPIYGILYFLLRTNNTIIFTYFIKNNQLMKEFITLFNEEINYILERLHLLMYNLIEENVIINKKDIKIKHRDPFYETLINIIINQTNSNNISNNISNINNNKKLPKIISTFEDFLFYRLITKDTILMEKEINETFNLTTMTSYYNDNYNINNDNHFMLYIFYNVLFNKINNVLYLLYKNIDYNNNSYNNNIVYIYTLLYYYYHNNVDISNVFKYFIDLSVCLLTIICNNNSNNENNEFKMFLIKSLIPSNNIGNNNITNNNTLSIKMKTYLINKLVDSGCVIDYQVLINSNNDNNINNNNETDQVLIDLLVCKLRTTNNRNIIINNKDLLDYEVWLSVLVEDFSIYLCETYDFNINSNNNINNNNINSNNNKKYKFISIIIDQINIISIHNNDLNILLKIYNYFINPTLSNLKQTILNKPAFYNIYNMNQLVYKLIRNSISLIKLHKEQFLAKNIIELFMIYNINIDTYINSVADDLILLF
ncbi:hypothetical protein CDIK_2392 [Cucumispora dikerogammari]|nr:hypothetical protein CDIK_2392 [Cucumispora dikerogammari]